MTKPTFSLPIIMDARTTKKLLDDEVNRYGGLIYDGSIAAASDPTLAQQVADDVAASASAAQQSADDAALYDGPRFDTVTDFFGPRGTFTAGTYVRTDAEGFAYRAVDTATATTVANADGQNFEVLPGADENLPLRAFGVADATDLKKAIEAADAKGMWLDWGSAQLNITSQVDATVSRLRWKHNGAKVTYTGASDIVTPFQINLASDSVHEIVGSGLEFDGGGKSHRGIRFTQSTGEVTAEFYGENLIVRNIEMQDGSLHSGSAGINVRGGFKKVTLVSPQAYNMKMRTGSGVATSAGIQGIQVLGVASTPGAYSLETRIIRPKVRRVYSEDAAYTFDMDGIGVFANPDTDGTKGPSYASITDADIEGCWGRDIKLQVYRGDIINPKSLVNETPAGGKEFPIYDFQTGPGQLVGGEYTIDGVVCNETSEVVRFSCGDAAAPAASSWVGGSLTMVNGGSMVSAMRVDFNTTNKCLATAENVSVNGTLREVSYIRTNGNLIDLCKLQHISVTSLTDALFRVEARGGGASPYIAGVYAENCINLGADVPTVRQRVSGSSAHSVLSESGLVGFRADKSYRSTSGTISGGEVVGFRRPEAVDPSLYKIGGERYIQVRLNDLEEYTLPEHGIEGSSIIEIKSSRNSRLDYALLSQDTANFVVISKGASFEVAATEPTTGNYRVWLDAGRVKLKNAQGATRSFHILMRG